jgi:cation diffusion facilitator family transporter
MSGEAARRGESTLTAERRQSARLVLVLVLIGAFFFVELIGAKIARSDVLEADAFHLLMDVFAIAISLFAMRIASRKPNARFTFGLRRAEPLAALANGVLVLGVAVELVRDAIEHLGDTSMPRSSVMLVVASAALVVNGLNAWLLHGVMGHGHHGHSHGHGPGHGHGHREEKHEHEHEGHVHACSAPHDSHSHDAHSDGEEVERGHQLNLRGAWLHLLGDALGSLAAFIAGLAIRLGAPPVVDPVASFFVVAILVVGALRLLRDAGLVLLEAAPQHLPVAKVEKALLAIDGITAVSALHVWSLGTGHDAIIARVRTSSKDPHLGTKATELLRKRFTCEYVAVQVEVD